MKKLDVIAAVLLVVGGINWGVVGVTGSDLVGTLFGNLSPVESGGLHPGRTRRAVSGGPVEGNPAPLAARLRQVRQTVAIRPEITQARTLS